MTRARTLYSRSSQRVQDSLHSFQEELGSYFATRGKQDSGVEILIVREGVCDLGGELEPTTSQNLDWLRKRLARSGLAGLEFRPAVGEDGLLDFTEDLLENHLRCGDRRGKEPVWSRAYEGLNLLHLRFTGGFSGGAGGPSAPGLPGVAGRNPAGAVGASHSPAEPVGAQEPGLEKSEEELLVELLASNQELVQRIHALGDGLSPEEECIELADASDLLVRIVRLLPADAFKDIEQVTSLTGAVLEVALREQRELGEAYVDFSNDADLRQLLTEASRGVFSRRADDEDQVAELVRRHQQEPPQSSSGAAGGRSGDDAITEDLSEFLTEFDELAEPIHCIFKRDVDVPIEQLGVYLHLLVNHGSDKVVRSLHPVLSKLLARPGPEELDILRPYLVPDAAEGGLTPRALDRMGCFLREEGLFHVLRATGALDVDWVLRSFPQSFPIYLQGLDFEDWQQVCELDGICTRLGAIRLLAAGDELAKHGSLMDGELVERICSIPFPSLMPIVRIMLRGSGPGARTHVVRYLSSLWPDREDCCLLRIMEAEKLPVSYLLSLMHPCPGADQHEQIGATISRTLYSYVRESAGNDSPSRIDAIRCIASFPSIEATELLLEMMSKRELLLPKEPRSVRLAAERTLKAIGGEPLDA